MTSNTQLTLTRSPYVCRRFGHDTICPPVYGQPYGHGPSTQKKHCPMPLGEGDSLLSSDTCPRLSSSRTDSEFLLNKMKTFLLIVQFFLVNPGREYMRQLSMRGRAARGAAGRSLSGYGFCVYLLELSVVPPVTSLQNRAALATSASSRRTDRDHSYHSVSIYRAGDSSPGLACVLNTFCW